MQHLVYDSTLFASINIIFNANKNAICIIISMGLLLLYFLREIWDMIIITNRDTSLAKGNEGSVSLCANELLTCIPSANVYSISNLL